MQQPLAACTRAQPPTRTCPCATCIWLLHPAPTSAQDDLDTLQLALVVFFCHQLVQIRNLHSWWSSPAICTGDVYIFFIILYGEFGCVREGTEKMVTHVRIPL